MKTKLAIAALFSSLLSLSAAAQESSFYVSGAVGQSKFDIDGLAGDTKDTSVNLGLGYNFNKSIGIEIGFADFGSVRFSGVTGKAESGYVTMMLSAPFTDALSAYGRLGAASTNRKITFGSFGSDSDRKTEGFYGVGLRYAFMKNLSGTVEFQQLQDSDVQALNVGLRLHF